MHRTRGHNREAGTHLLNSEGKNPAIGNLVAGDKVHLGLGYCQQEAKQEESLQIAVQSPAPSRFGSHSPTLASPARTF